MEKSKRDGLESKKGARTRSERLRIKPGFDHLACRHPNKYPLDIEPETDPQKFSNSLDAFAAVG